MPNLNLFIAWLEEKHSQIMGFETAALEDLKKADIEGYNFKMLEKAKNLSSLFEESQSHISEVPPMLRGQVETTLEGYSTNARTAMELDSVFYMSALLYPDEHKKGEPDNMQKFIDGLKKRAI